MMEKGGETFKINTEGQDTTSELPTFREAIHYCENVNKANYKWVHILI